MSQLAGPQDEHLFEISENFFSLEGEGPYTGKPTAYIRIARCNLKCPLFNNHNKAMTSTGYADIGFDPKDYKNIKDMPIISRGCDSQYSVNPAFSHMWRAMDAEGIIDDILGLIPFRSFIAPTGNDVAISITGGEPTLRWKELHRIFLHPKMKDCKHIIIETNASVPFKEPFIEDIARWLDGDPNRKWTWSNSPKLTSSGHSRRQTIKPAVIALQSTLVNRYPSQCDQYFKFVVGPRDDHFNEVDEVMQIYRDAGVLTGRESVWMMPMACTHEQQDEVSKEVANMCRDRGYNFAFRLQNALWKNAVST